MSLYFTGILIFITPATGISKERGHVGALSYLYCFLVANFFILFVFGKSSAFIVMLLALERWFTVMRPHAYKISFTRSRVVKYVALIIVITIITQIYKITETKLQSNGCVSKPGIFGKEGKNVFLVVYVLIFLVANLITWVLFVQIWCRIKTNPQSLIGTTEQARQRQKLLLRMCFMTSAVLTVCWLPKQIMYVLNNFGVTDENSIESHISFMLAMSNSFLNPWIYFLSNKEYRNEFLSLFSFFK